VRDLGGLDGNSELGGAVMRSIVRASQAVTAAMGPDGINVTHAAGEAAGQDVFHAHFHIHPRYSGDGMLPPYPSRPAQPSRAELDRMAAEIGLHLDR